MNIMIEQKYFIFIFYRCGTSNSVAESLKIPPDPVGSVTRPIGEIDIRRAVGFSVDYVGLRCNFGGNLLIKIDVVC